MDKITLEEHVEWREREAHEINGQRDINGTMEYSVTEISGIEYLEGVMIDLGRGLIIYIFNKFPHDTDAAV